MRALAGILGLALLWTAHATGPPAEGSDPPSAAVALEPAEDTTPLPELALADLSGTVSRLSQYRGQVTVINLWATWCGPCVHEMPALNRAARALSGEAVSFIGLNIGETPGAIRAFLDRVPVEFTVLLDPEQRMLARSPVLGLPTTVVLARGGRVAHRVIGIRPWDHPVIVAQLRALARSDP